MQHFPIWIAVFSCAISPRACVVVRVNTENTILAPLVEKRLRSFWINTVVCEETLDYTSFMTWLRHFFSNWRSVTWGWNDMTEAQIVQRGSFKILLVLIKNACSANSESTLTRVKFGFKQSSSWCLWLHINFSMQQWSLQILRQGSRRNWLIKFNDFSMTFSWPLLKIFHDSEMLKTHPFWGIFLLGDKENFPSFQTAWYFGTKNWNSMTFPWPGPFFRKSMTFPGLENIFANSMTFHDRMSPVRIRYF